MANVQNYGILPTSTGEQNREALFAAWKLGLGELYFPKGTYQLAPINAASATAAGVASNQSRYQNMRGDGLKNTVIQLASGYSGCGLFDWSGMDHFDLSIAGMQFHGRDESSVVWKMNSGGIHYRVSFHNCWFRNSAGDGLILESGQLFNLDAVTATGCTGIGVYLHGPLGVYGTIDVESCGTGLVVEGMAPYRPGDPAVNLNVYAEQNDVEIRDCTHVRLNVVGATTRIERASHCDIVGNAEFNKGAILNRAASGTGVYRWANAVGNNVPMSAALESFDGTKTAIIDRDPITAEGFDYDTWVTLTPGPKKVKFVSEAIRQGKGVVYLVVQRNVGGWKWFNWKTYAMTTAGESVLVPVTSERRQYELPFDADVAGSYRIRVSSPSLDEDSRIRVFDVRVIDQ